MASFSEKVSSNLCRIGKRLTEFVESIPFTETREYVQAILRNASVYKQLYGAP
jgi:soluble lytic murein transglycosylase-like protein